MKQNPLHASAIVAIHDRVSRCAITGELRARRGFGAVDKFKRLKRLAPAAPALKASMPGPDTLSGRLGPNARRASRWGIALVAGVHQFCKAFDPSGA